MNWNSFTIMHGEKAVVSINNNGECNIINKDFMPYNLYFNTDDDSISARINNLNNFYYWCSSRLLTLDRKYAKEILNSIGKKQAVTDKDRAEIAITYHSLSLTDIYWVKTDSENLCFADINLFEHSLSNSFVDVSLCGKQLTAENSALIKNSDVAGDIGTLGVAPKAWVRKDGKFYLYKDGDIRDVEAELLASKIIDCFDVNHIQYSPAEYDNQKVTACEIITSLNRSIVPMEHIEIYAANNDIDRLDLVMQQDAYSYYMMNIVDYLIGNTDRHWANWGFLVDNESNTLIRLYPLMDYNKAFNSYDAVEGTRCQTTDKIVSQMDAAVIAVKQIGLNQIAEIESEWFANPNEYEMFNKRLNILKKIKA